MHTDSQEMHVQKRIDLTGTL